MLSKKGIINCITFNIFLAKDMYRAASVKNNENSCVLFHVVEICHTGVQNNTVIYIANAVKWMAINEKCLIWSI